jgi:hypothetical protein
MEGAWRKIVGDPEVHCVDVKTASRQIQLIAVAAPVEWRGEVVADVPDPCFRPKLVVLHWAPAFEVYPGQQSDAVGVDVPCLERWQDEVGAVLKVRVQVWVALQEQLRVET